MSGTMHNRAIVFRKCASPGTDPVPLPRLPTYDAVQNSLPVRCGDTDRRCHAGRRRRSGCRERACHLSHAAAAVASRLAERYHQRR